MTWHIIATMTWHIIATMTWHMIEFRAIKPHKEIFPQYEEMLVSVNSENFFSHENISLEEPKPWEKRDSIPITIARRKQWESSADKKEFTIWIKNASEISLKDGIEIDFIEEVIDS